VEHCDEPVCLFVCPHANLRKKPHIQTSPNFFVHVTYGLGSIVLCQRCNVLCVSGLADDVGKGHAKRAYTRNDLAGGGHGPRLYAQTDSRGGSIGLGAEFDVNDCHVFDVPCLNADLDRSVCVTEQEILSAYLQYEMNKIT